MIICFGETLMRLRSPSGHRLLGSGRLETYIGGAELNVASALVAYDLTARCVTALPENPLGLEVFDHIKGRGVLTDQVSYLPGRLGLYYEVPGSDLRGGEITYDREGSAFSKLRAEDLNLDAILKDATWLHMSGVTLALGAEIAEAAIALAEEAAARNLPVSFDFNHRAKLWARWDGEPAHYLRRMVSCATLVIGNDFDLMKVLDEPKARASRSLHLADKALAAYPRLALIASAYRTVQRAQRHSLQAEIVTRDIRILSSEIILESVIDRVGGGDAFAAGLIAGTLKGLAPDLVLNRAFSSMVLKHGWQGDRTKSTWAEVEAFDPAESGDVKR